MRTVLLLHPGATCCKAVFLGALLSLLLIGALIPTFPALSQPTYTYLAFHSEFHVQADGTVIVRHRVTYRFQNPSGWVGLNLPTSLGRVTAAQVLSGGGEPLPDELWDFEQDESGCVIWFNCSSAGETTTVIYQFTVVDALRVRGERVFLEWNGVPVDRASPVEESSVTVELPCPLSPGELQLEVTARNYPGQVQKRVVGDRKAIAELQWLTSDTTYDFSASWPSRIMNLSGAGFAHPEEESALSGRKSWAFQRFDVDIAVHPDASFTVRETQVVDFRGGFAYLNRDLSTLIASIGEGRTYGKVRIHDIAVYDLDGNPYDRNLWSVEDLQEGKRVHLEFQAADEIRGWIIEYRMTGALVFASDYDRLCWNAVPKDREVNIRSSRVTVHLPPGVDPERVNTEMHVDPYAPPRESDHGRDGDVLWWMATDIPPFTTFTVDVSFPKGTVGVPWPYAKKAGVICIASSAFFLFLVLLTMLALVWRKGRKVGRKTFGMVHYDPPEGLTPAMVGTLVRQRPDVRDITATIVDLARRGYLSVFEQEKRSVIRRRVFGFQKREGDLSHLLPYEREILTALFESGERVTEDDLRNNFHRYLKDIKKKMSREVIQRGLFDRDPVKGRRTYLYAGLALVVVSTASFLALPAWFDLGWLQLPILALIPSGLIVCLVGWFMPRRSRKGAVAYHHALGFKEYLRAAEKSELEHMTSEYFERNLPYAMVLGVADEWVSKFDDIYTESPLWFSSAEPGRGPSSFRAFVSSMDRSLSQTFSASPPSADSGAGFGEGGPPSG